MDLISISSDRKIFEKNSLVRQRVVDQASLTKHLTVIVFSLKKHHLETFSIDNLTVIPTNSNLRLMYPYDAYRIASGLRADLITTQDPFESGIAGVLLKIKRGFGLQIQAHTDFLSSHFRRESILNFARFLISLIVIPQADSVRAVSLRVKKSIEDKFKNNIKVDVLPVYRDLKRPAEGVFLDLHRKYPEFGFILLSAGRLEREKNANLLLEAFAGALYMISDAGLVIVGEGGQRKKLEEKATKLGVRDRVKFEGWQENLVPYYESADLFVSTSNYEGYGLTLLEAAYYGCPVLTTDVGIAGEVLRDNESALVCPVGDRECLSNKMAEIRRFVDLRRRIASGGKIAARGAVWSKENYLLRLNKIWKRKA